MSTPEEALLGLAERMATKPDISCPHCGEKLAFEVAAQAMENSKMSFTITPHEGELLGAKTVGGSIENVAALLVSVGKSMDANVQVLVNGLHYNAGAVTVDLLVARSEKGVGKRKKATP
jgi:hypothetical protein